MVPSSGASACRHFRETRGVHRRCSNKSVITHARTPMLSPVLLPVLLPMLSKSTVLPVRKARFFRAVLSSRRTSSAGEEQGGRGKALIPTRFGGAPALGAIGICRAVGPRLRTAALGPGEPDYPPPAACCASHLVSCFLSKHFDRAFSVPNGAALRVRHSAVAEFLRDVGSRARSLSLPHPTAQPHRNSPLTPFRRG